jgi:hypothetical protein
VLVATATGALTEAAATVFCKVAIRRLARHFEARESSHIGSRPARNASSTMNPTGHSKCR